MRTAVVLPRPAHVVDMERARAVPFHLGTVAYDAGRPITDHDYPEGSLAAESFADGWEAARSVRMDEATGAAREALNQAVAERHVVVLTGTATGQCSRCGSILFDGKTEPECDGCAIGFHLNALREAGAL